MQQDRRDTPGRAGRACGARRDHRHAFPQHNPKVTQQAGRRLNCRIGTSHDFTIHAKQNVVKLRKSLVLIQFDCATVWMGVADPVTSLTNFFSRVGKCENRSVQLQPSCYVSFRHAACVLVVLSEGKAIAAAKR
jgi:hypothetical protein